MTIDNFCFYLQNRLIQTSQTGQWYSDTSPFSIPWHRPYVISESKALLTLVIVSAKSWQFLFREEGMPM
jgi:hypothetical protein